MPIDLPERFTQREFEVLLKMARAEIKREDDLAFSTRHMSDAEMAALEIERKNRLEFERKNGIL